MITIDVPASRPYRVSIGSDALSMLGGTVRELCPTARIAALVSDDAVFPLHGERALASLREAGLEVVEYVVPSGEASKTADTLAALLNALAARRLTRSDVLVALGGGMIGDLTGFAAAVYMRGVACVQCPTTLLSAVDSSVGGKTAVDLPAGKNLMGAFWPPRSVLCDTDTLGTLPEGVFADGCAEVVKTAVLFDPELFDTLSREGLRFDREAVVARCVGHKRDVVAEDEFDTGRRALLNLGHTLGHAVEARSGFSLSHGKSVAIGTATVCRAAAKYGFCGTEVPAAVEALLGKLGLPAASPYPIGELLPLMLSDKKRSGDTVSVVVPERIGRCGIRPMTADELRAFMEAGL